MEKFMREIKFRAWNKELNVMIRPEGVMMLPKGDGGQQMSAGAGWQYELMQFTGLKDKNGKEIYEGDLIKIVDSPLYTVIWHFNRFILRGHSTHEFRKIDVDHFYQVVGNIYENSELLK